MGLALSLLLDTSTLIWAAASADRLSPAARDALDGGMELWVSAASAWEIATKHRIGRLPGVRSLIDDWDDQLERFGLRQLDIRHRHALRAGSFDVEHADPFDRLIAAQGEIEELTVVTSDRSFDLFPVTRLW